MVVKNIFSWSLFVLLILFNVDLSFGQNNPNLAQNKDNKTELTSQHKKYSLMEDKNDLWLLFGINGVGETEYKLNGDAKGSSVNYTGIFGGDIWKFLGVELTLAGTVGNIDNTNKSINMNMEYTSFDVLVHLLFIPKININNIFSIRPYVGMGPSFHYMTMDEKVGEVTSKSYTSSLDIGGSFKAGVRFQVLKYLMVGINLEYIIHETTFNDAFSEKMDFSNLKGGLEIGVSF